jgi:hypothetical protein
MAAPALLTTDPEHKDVFADFLEDLDWVIGVVVTPVSKEVGRHTTHRRPHADAAHSA